MTRVRWTVCLLLFFAIAINYLDRQLFPLLVPYFIDDLRLGPLDLARINVSFAMPYGFGMLLVGWWIDRVGTKRGMAVSFIIWNLASMAHALVGGMAGFMATRFCLGIGESGGFPCAIKTVAEWFPKKERALATGWFNAGSNLGSMLAPLLTVFIAERYGWRACFVSLGIIGFVWIFFWQALYATPSAHPKVNEAEIAHIRSDAEESEAPITYPELFGMRPLYAFAIGKFFTDAPWWFYLFWLPKFMDDVFHVSSTFRVIAVMVVYLIADVGSVFGGWLSSRLIDRGFGLTRARRIAMLVCAFAVTPVGLMGFIVDRKEVLGIPTVFVAIALVALAASAHQGWSCNLFTLSSDTLPKSALAKAVGVSMTFSVVGVSLLQLFVGRCVAITGSYLWPFLVAASLYLIGWIAIRIVLPEVKPAVPGKRASMGLVGVGLVGALALVAWFNWLINRPPYDDLADYQAKRSIELRANGSPTPGPEAKVGWMDAKWMIWSVDGKPKLELVKFDGDGRPIVEGKGDQAGKYKGPKKSEIPSEKISLDRVRQ